MWCHNGPSLKRWVFMTLLMADLFHNIHAADLCPEFWSTRLEAQRNPHPERHSGDRVHTCAPMEGLLSESHLGINMVNRRSLRSAARWRGCACLGMWARACAFLCNGVGVICQDHLARGHFYTRSSSPLRGCRCTGSLSVQPSDFHERATPGNGSIVSPAHNRQHDPTFTSSLTHSLSGAFQQQCTFKKRRPWKRTRWQWNYGATKVTYRLPCDIIYVFSIYHLYKSKHCDDESRGIYIEQS